MNTYKAFYPDRPSIDIKAETTYEAKKKAIVEFERILRRKIALGKRHLLTVHLCEADGKPVVHTPDF